MTPTPRSPLHPRIAEVTERIRARSQNLRQAYLDTVAHWQRQGTQREHMSCANLAHTFAASPADDKLAIKALRVPNIGIVTAYNDMLSAHQPYASYPDQIKAAARAAGGVAQVAGGVPAMCDGITQGNEGMELSLFSRDVIAMATAVALSHQTFDAAMCLGICDKIVPGLLIGALQFGHLPVVFVPAGPMRSGLANDRKAKVRQEYAQGKVDRAALLEAESASYHSAGTCTFYGTANSNQMLMEIMGLQLPGSAFVPPDDPLRAALTDEATRRALAMSAQGAEPTVLAQIVDERAIVNGIVGLLATGGSTNHTLHLVAMARAAGLRIDWTDFAELSEVVPLMTRIYPNGTADVNHFHAAGGMGFLIRELLDAGLLHPDVATVAGPGLAHYTREPWLQDGRLAWRDAPADSGDLAVLRPAREPFSADGGLKLLQGNLGRSVIKVSAVKPEHRHVRAPAVVVDDPAELIAQFKAGQLERDFVAVLRHQGPQANGMPELHTLTPVLGVLQDRGFHVALVTDGRMSGASGKVPAAIHLSPEALAGGAIARLRSGDIIELDAHAGRLVVELSDDELASRPIETADLSAHQRGCGRELFATFRRQASRAEAGGSALFPEI